MMMMMMMMMMMFDLETVCREHAFQHQYKRQESPQNLCMCCAMLWLGNHTVLVSASQSCSQTMLLSWTSRVQPFSALLQGRAASVRLAFNSTMAPKRKAAVAPAKTEAPAAKKTKAPKKANAEKSATPAATSDGRKLSLIIEAW